MRRSSFITASAYAALAAPLAATAQTATVKIGYIDSFSGALADIAEHHILTVTYAIEEANRRGRTRFELVKGDDNSVPPTGGTESRRLMTQENVDVLLLGTSSAVALAV